MRKKGIFIYVVIVAIIAALTLIYLYNKYSTFSFYEVLFWGCLAIVTETFLIPISTSMAISVGLSVSVTATVLYSPFVGVVVAGIGIALRMPSVNGIRKNIFNTEPFIIIFNIAQAIIAIGLAGEILYSIMSYEGSNISTLTSVIPSVLLIIFICNLINSLLISIMLYYMKGNSFIETYIGIIKNLVPSLVSVGSLGVIMAMVRINYNNGVVLLFFAPLLLARYSFKLYVDSQHMAMETIHALNDALGVKDAYTGGHASRVQEYAVKLADAKGMKKNNIEKIRTAALLHDIGKIGIPDLILNKKGRLSDDEYIKIKEHPVMGSKILSNVDSLKEISNIIKHHHERYDGTGYPDALKNGAIPLESSILSIADSFDAMTTDRPYKNGINQQEAVEELLRNKGTQFDPDLVDLFIEVIMNKVKL